MRTLRRAEIAPSNCWYTAMRPSNGLAGGGWMATASAAARTCWRSRSGSLLSSYATAREGYRDVFIRVKDRKA